MRDVTRIRQAIRNTIPAVSAETGALRPENIYFPTSHLKALRKESSLVVGSRGVGKTFWTKVLSDEALRKPLIATVSDLKNVRVSVGYAVTQDIDKYPDKDTLTSLFNGGFDPETIWTGVLVRWLSSLTGDSIPTQTWENTTVWVRNNPELVARLLQKTDQYLQTENMYGLILFDALDRTSDKWETRNIFFRGLLKVLLRLTGFKGLFGKVFLREDQLTNTTVNFPDASKLQATRCELSWQLHDLHGLLWQTLCNAKEEDGEILRELYIRGDSATLIDGNWQKIEDVYQISSAAMRQGDVQKSLFHTLAGPWMGKDKRRGVPYIWVVSHLADGKQHTSPRSFLAALGTAAEDSLERYPDFKEYVLHYESIKRGVQKASTIRVNEMYEDYPWVETLFEPLLGKFNVPIDFSTVTGLWANTFSSGFNEQANLLSPVAPGDWQGILKQLVHLGICEIMRDGRINMPDLYRVAFNLGRKGGVKPVINK